MTPTRPVKAKAPKHLGPAGRALFRALQAEYSIQDAGGLLLLTAAGECVDRMAAARVAIEQHGELIEDRYGKPRVSPACALEKDARGQLLQAVKMLGLDVEPDSLTRKKGFSR